MHAHCGLENLVLGIESAVVERIAMGTIAILPSQKVGRSLSKR